MRRLVKWMRAGAAGPAAGAWGLTLTLVLALVIFLPTPAQFSLNLKSGGAPTGTAANHSSQWTAVDAEADLTGLWAEIDVVHDQDPFFLADEAGGQDHLVWAQWSGSSYQIVHARRPVGSLWEQPEAVQLNTGSTLDNISPRGTIDDLGLLHVAWVREGAASGFIYHAVRVSGGWTEAGVVSGNDSLASELVLWQEQGATLLDYESTLDLVHIEVEVVGYSGGSDDVDPTEITVNRWEIGRSILPQ